LVGRSRDGDHTRERHRPSGAAAVTRVARDVDEEVHFALTILGQAISKVLSEAAEVGEVVAA
jgi:hypothetical protein